MRGVEPAELAGHGTTAGPLPRHAGRMPVTDTMPVARSAAESGTGDALAGRTAGPPLGTRAALTAATALAAACAAATGTSAASTATTAGSGLGDRDEADPVRAGSDRQRTCRKQRGCGYEQFGYTHFESSIFGATGNSLAGSAVARRTVRDSTARDGQIVAAGASPVDATPRTEYRDR